MNVTTRETNRHLRLLAHRSREGDYAATNELFSWFAPRIKKKALRAWVKGRTLMPGVEIDDLVQHGNIGLLSAIRNDKAENDTPFSAFAEICITHQISVGFKHHTYGKHRVLNEADRLEQTFTRSHDDEDGTLADVIPAPGIDVEREVIGNLTAHDLCGHLRQHLSLEQTRMLGMRAVGMTDPEIARDAGCALSTVERRIRDAKGVARSYLDGAA